MNFLELQQQLAREMDDDSITGNSDMKVLLNRAYEDVCNEADWPFLEGGGANQAQTVADQKSYSLPSDYKKMVWLSVGDEDSDEDTFYQYVRFSDRKRLTSNRYYLWGGSYYLNPTPTETGTELNLYYLKDVTALSDDADTTLVPDEYDEIVVTRGAILYKQRDEEYVAAREYMGVYNNLLSKMKQNLLTKTIGQMDRILQMREGMAVGNQNNTMIL